MDMSMGLVTVVITLQTTCNWHQLPGPLLFSSLESFGLGWGLKWSEILLYLKVGGLILTLLFLFETFSLSASPEFSVLLLKIGKHFVSECEVIFNSQMLQSRWTTRLGSTGTSPDVVYAQYQPRDGLTSPGIAKTDDIRRSCQPRKRSFYQT